MNNEDFEKAQQELVDSFKAQLTSICDNVISKFYCDLTPFAVTDAHINFKNALRDEITEDFTKEIAQEYGHYSWTYSMRMKLLKDYPEVLQNTIISNLQERVKSLEEHLEQIRTRY